jgi:hypothetical protein
VDGMIIVRGRSHLFAIAEGKEPKGKEKPAK